MALPVVKLELIEDDPKAGEKYGQTWGRKSYRRFLDEDFSCVTLQYYEPEDK